MANRIVGNVVIIDSAMANNFIFTSGGTLTNITELKVGAFAFWSSDTTGTVVLTGVSTADHVVKLTNPNNSAATIGIVLNGINFSQLKVPTLTSGTAWIYLK